jgi:hypothetical protein
MHVPFLKGTHVVMTFPDFRPGLSHSAAARLLFRSFDAAGFLLSYWIQGIYCLQVFLVLRCFWGTISALILSHLNLDPGRSRIPARRISREFRDVENSAAAAQADPVYPDVLPACCGGARLTSSSQKTCSNEARLYSA